jgi:hypothetical protein
MGQGSELMTIGKSKARVYMEKVTGVTAASSAPVDADLVEGVVEVVRLRVTPSYHAG